MATKGFGPMIHNHLENNRVITTKTGLIRSLLQFYTNNVPEYFTFDTIPTSFVITAHCRDIEYYSFLNRYNEISARSSRQERLPLKHVEKNMWLVKPAAMNQGRGIEICHTLDKIKHFISSKPDNTMWLVQKYIERPLLFYDRKFDIRVWAFATARHELFYYKHGYLRTSSAEYDTKAQDNFIHLTNNCLQKHGDLYGKHEEGNTLSFDVFQEYLDNNHPNIRVNDHIVPRIKDLIIDSYLSGQAEMVTGKRMDVFELFGFDFLVDEDFRVWLIEVNTNPYFGIPNDYIRELLPNMIDDLLCLTVDHIFKPSKPRQRQINDFELLYCPGSSRHSPDGELYNQRRPYDSPIYPLPQLHQIPLSEEQPQNIQQQPEHKFKRKASVPIQPKKQTKTIVPGLVQQAKNIIEGLVLPEPYEFEVVAGRVISNLTNWELMSEAQQQEACQALKLLCQSSGVQAILEYQHIPAVLHLCFTENIPDLIQLETLDAFDSAVCDTNFCRAALKLGASEKLVDVMFKKNVDSAVRRKVFDIMCTITRHPTKNFYIPGKTREHNWIRKIVMKEGLVASLYKIAHDSSHDFAEDAQKHLNSEFNLSDWEKQVAILNKILHGSRQKKKRSSKAANRDTTYINFPREIYQTEFLSNMKEELMQYCTSRKEEMRKKAEEERLRKQQEYEEKLRARELEDQLYLQRRQQAEEELLRRYRENCRKRNEDLKKREQLKLQDIKIDEEKRVALLEKQKQQIRMKRIHDAKKKQQQEEERQREEMLRQELQEKRRKAMED